MQIHHVGYRIRGFYRLTQFGHRWDMIPHEAHHRLKILHFCARHGPAATGEAFGVSRRTLYRWQRALTQAGGDPQALAVRSRAPHRRRQATWPPALSQAIRRLRTTYPNRGKAKLHVLLRPWCAQHGLALPRVSTIGRLIARAPDRMRHTPSRLDARGRPKPRTRRRKSRPPRPRPAPGGLGRRSRCAAPRRTPPLPIHLHRSLQSLRLRCGHRHRLQPPCHPRPRCTLCVAPGPTPGPPLR